MKQILVTGATGNIGIEVIRYLSKLNSDSTIVAAVRNIEKAKQTLKNYPDLHYRQFDFENESTYYTAFDKINILFLLRPSHMSNVEVFSLLLNSAQENGIRKIIFLSVQGAEKSKLIPHNKIERLIQKLKFDYIFVRPSYFMQNLTTTLLPEILSNKSVTLPSGKAKFNWVDVKNIGEVTALLILNFDSYRHQAYELTGTENKSFKEVTGLLTSETGQQIKFKNVNPFSFYFRKKKAGVQSRFAMVMTLLHFLPRFQAEPSISENYQKFTGKVPTTLQDFIKREKEKITTSRQRV